jgi:hypothetical protein
MKPLSYLAARVVVATYNDTRCVRETARVLNLSRDLVRTVTDWLWHRTFHKETVMKNDRKPRIKISEDFWCEFLYANGATPEDAAESLDWALDRVLQSCRGPDEWRKTKRKPLFTKNCAQDTDPRPDDPTVDELYSRAAELRKSWAPTDARHGQRPDRVEVREYIFDGHNPQIFRLS